MRIVNLCPHEIDLRAAGSPRIVIPPSGTPARVKVRHDGARALRLDLGGGPLAQVPVTTSYYGEVDNLPDPEPDTYYVVSYPVAYARPERADLLVPDDLIRDERGTVVACQSLTRVTSSPETVVVV